MKFYLIPILFLLSFNSIASEYNFILQCDFDDKNSSPTPFYFISQNKGSQIIFLKSDGIIAHKGGESVSISLVKVSNEFYEYKFHQTKTSLHNESDSEYALDRSSLRLSETIKFKDSKDPLYLSYKCKKVKDEQSIYNSAISLKRKFDSGSYNQI